MSLFVDNKCIYKSSDKEEKKKKKNYSIPLFLTYNNDMYKKHPSEFSIEEVNNDEVAGDNLFGNYSTMQQKLGKKEVKRESNKENKKQFKKLTKKQSKKLNKKQSNRLTKKQSNQ